MADKQFTWIPFYMELADKLIDYRDNRKPLIDWIYANREAMQAKSLHDNGGVDDLLEDIDPFTVFGLFNKHISLEKRIKTISLLKERFNVKADVPKDFEGVPVLLNLSSYFFAYRDKRGENDIDNLWALFDKVINKKDCEAEFNKVIKQHAINVRITMGLYWIRPNEFLALDTTNRNYLNKFGIDLPSKVPEYKVYRGIIDDIKEKMASNALTQKSFVELSDNAWYSIDKNNNKNKDKEPKTEDIVKESEKEHATEKTEEEVVVEEPETELEKSGWGNAYARLWKKKKNLVIQGAPGTGKTYCVPELVVRLCESKSEFDADKAGRKKLMAEYNRLKEEKRVMFTTFHQSMDYEDWLEGLRPELDEDNQQVTYNVEPGIFKKVCEEAERPLPGNVNVNIPEDATVWKVSLGGTGVNPLRTDCMENGYIRIGYDEYGKEITEETDWSKHKGEGKYLGKSILNAFMNDMKIGDVVMSCFSSRTVDAIGIVTGEYEWHEEFDKYKRLRKVNWLVKGINENIVKLNDDKQMTLGTVYRLKPVTLDKVKTILDKYGKSKTLIENTRPYVIVIDEFNRGNVSKIFGELITLLEPDKRKGEPDAESVLLPYSKKAFYIPSNVYVIATMNTADRSLGTIDYAIRRRFAFVTVKPKEIEDSNFNKDLFKKVSELFIANYDDYAASGFDDAFKLERAETLSSEYRPEEMWIGHSYFIMKDAQDVKDRLLYEIIPLLEEYIRDGVLTEGARETVDDLYRIAASE